jgi:aspartate racemase
MLTMQGAARKELELHQLQTYIEVIHNATSKCDLSLYVNQHPSHRLELWLEYNAELFEAPTIKNILLHYQTLLEEIVSGPGQRIAELPLLTESEQQTLLVDWNTTKTEFSRHSCIHQLFEIEVERRAEVIAVSFGEVQLTYRELNRRANQLAHYLQAQGVGLEDRVAVLLERSANLVVSLLAVLKAGGAYVPLDPHYPAERLSSIINDAEVRLVLTDSAFRHRTDNSSTGVVCLDEEWKQIGKQEEQNPESRAEASNLAYLIYTSGSAGQPKGVAVTNRGVVRLVKDTNYVELGPEEVLLLLSPITFDASTFEIWGSLLNGATLAIMPPGPFTIEELGEVLRDYKVTTLWLTAGLFHLMVSRRVEDLMSLRQLIAGGDVLSPLHVETFLATAVHSRLINGYGPTENTTFTCSYSMTGPASFESSVPIGRPIANTSAYVLDRQMRLVPRGVWGELYAGGDGLARCYFNRPALTAASFVPNPFSARPGARLYRTGDLARHLPDGNIEFGGRLDQQVKVRGFRIEPQEIESVLCQHDAVAECIVTAREDVPGDQRLIAYIVPSGTQIGTGDLRSYLSEKLPQYMIPTAFVLLQELPLMTNGKVDRQALPAPEVTRANSGDFIAPRGQTEQELAEIWSEVLRVERISVQDNFFDLGGHSLLATQLLSRIRSTFAVDLKLQDVFVSPTIEASADMIDTALIMKSGDSRIDEALDMLEKLADDEVHVMLNDRIV